MESVVNKSRLSVDQGINSSNISRSTKSSCSSGGSSSSSSSVASAAAAAGTAHHCGGCGKLIKDRYLLQALDSFWHEDCLKCGCCDCRLGEVGSTLYTRANLILCKRDYLRLFGATGNCAACCKMIPAFEMVMRAKNNVYHMECFACHQCHQRFCVGDRFFLCDNKILCEYDYEERIIFANMANNPANLALLQNQVADSQPMDTRETSRNQAWNPSSTSKVTNEPFGQQLQPPRGCEPGIRINASARSASRPFASNAHNPNQNHKQDSPVAEDASSSGYGSPDSGLAEDG